MVLSGLASLVRFALALTRIDSAFAGRAYAAYGGIYIAASGSGLWRGQPTRSDLLGAALAIAGAVIIIRFRGPVTLMYRPHHTRLDCP